MINDFENEIWESLLRAAVIKNSLDELEDYPSEEIEKTVLPDHYDQKIRRLIQRLYYKNAVRASFFYVRKIAALLFILMGISFVFLLHFDEVRATCHNVITYIFEKYILFQHETDLDDEPLPVKLEYIPEGFSLSEETLSHSGYDAVYFNSQGDMLFFESTPYKHTSQADNEHYNVYEVKIGHYIGQFFASTDNHFPNILYWQSEKEYYCLEAPLTEDEMIKIAENVK